MTATTMTVEEFKETELGPLPKEWDVIRLGELIEEVREKNKSNFQYPVFTVSNVHGFMLSDEFFDKRVYSKKLDTYKLVRSGYFAYNPYRVNVGSLALFDHEIGLVSPAYVVFRILRPEHLHPLFLYRLIKSPLYLDEIRRVAMSRGSVRRSLSFRDLSDFQIPHPPLIEQRKIAYVLSRVQTSIEKTEAVIKATRELKKSLTKHLFTYGPVSIDEAESVPLKETEIGMVPEGWEVVRLDEVITEGIRNGAFVRRSNFGNGVIFLNVADTYSNVSADLRVSERVQCTDEEFRLYEIKPGDLFYVRSSLKREGVGQCCVVEHIPEPSIYDCHLMRVRVDDERVIPKFLAYYSVSLPGKLSLISRSKTTTMTTINQRGLAYFAVPLPPIPTQREIANTLTAVDEKIQSEENKRQALESLFKTLLSSLMTGKIRVSSLEVSV